MEPARFSLKETSNLSSRHNGRIVVPLLTTQEKTDGPAFPLPFFREFLGFVADLEGGRDLLKKPWLNLEEA